MKKIAEAERIAIEKMQKLNIDEDFKSHIQAKEKISKYWVLVLFRGENQITGSERNT